MDGVKVSFARNATRSVSATTLQLSESLRPNISEVRRSTANTPSWMCRSRISRKVVLDVSELEQKGEAAGLSV
jgi:hypothetical protein